MVPKTDLNSIISEKQKFKLSLCFQIREQVVERDHMTQWNLLSEDGVNWSTGTVSENMYKTDLQWEGLRDRERERKRQTERKDFFVEAMRDRWSLRLTASGNRNGRHPERECETAWPWVSPSLAVACILTIFRLEHEKGESVLKCFRKAAASSSQTSFYINVIAHEQFMMRRGTTGGRNGLKCIWEINRTLLLYSLSLPMRKTENGKRIAKRLAVGDSDQ